MNFFLKRIVWLIILCNITVFLAGQNQYSIDTKEIKRSRYAKKIERIEKRENKKAQKKIKQEEKQADRIEKKISEKHTKIQTKEVQKRMKQSLKTAKRFNKSKPKTSFEEKLKNKQEKKIKA